MILKNWSATSQNTHCVCVCARACVRAGLFIFYYYFFYKPDETNKYTMSLTMLSCWTLNKHRSYSGANMLLGWGSL